MNTLRNLQHEFMCYLVDDAAPEIITRIESTPQRSAEQRMSYYGQAYILRLKEALCTDYERLHCYLGDELFDTLISQYIEKHPSQHTSLRYFGQHFLQFVEAFEPFKSLPEVAEITRIEQAFANSFDAADCPCVIQNQLAQLVPEAWASLTLSMHDSVQLLPLDYNSFQIWKMLNNEQMPPERTRDETTWLIWRYNLVSQYRALDKAELSALTIAISNGSFSHICEALLDHFSEEEVPLKAVGYLQQWINNQMVCGLNQ